MALVQPIAPKNGCHPQSALSRNASAPLTPSLVLSQLCKAFVTREQDSFSDLECL